MTERLLTMGQLGEALGLSYHQVSRWWREGRLPGYVLTDERTVRFRVSEVEAWLASCRKGGEAA